VLALKIGARATYQQMGIVFGPPTLQDGLGVIDRAAINEPSVDPNIRFGLRGGIQAARFPEKQGM
jgi:hypothetical protein